MSEKEGVIYILSNPAMPGLVKIGKTTNLDDRMSSLYSTGVPVPFHCVYAKRVNNYSEVEKKLHLGLRSKRENMNREFFRIAEEEVINFLELIEGVEVTPKEDKFENDDDKVAYEKSSKIGQRFNFEMVQIPKITGITVRQARKTIESLGFVFGEIEYVDDIARDEVISITNDSIELKEGDFLKKTSIIDFKLGNGKQ